MSPKVDNLPSRCVSEHPSFMELRDKVLASNAAIGNEEEDDSISESFSFLKDEREETSPHDNETEEGESIRKPNALERRVSFASLEIRVYEVIPGDHPYCSSGAPLSLGWEYHSSSELSLDHYESVRHPRRNRDQLRLSDEERESLLSANDCPVGEVRRAARRHHRTKSCEGRFCQRNMQTFFQK